ncbi:MAG: hypothetical protein WAQ57_01230 [Candidatus Saccharimonadales bacterium]
MTYEQEAASAVDYNSVLQVFPGDLPLLVQQRLEAAVRLQGDTVRPEEALQVVLIGMVGELAARDEQPQQLVA